MKTAVKSSQTNFLILWFLKVPSIASVLSASRSTYFCSSSVRSRPSSSCSSSFMSTSMISELLA